MKLYALAMFSHDDQQIHLGKSKEECYRKYCKFPRNQFDEFRKTIPAEKWMDDYLINGIEVGGGWVQDVVIYNWVALAEDLSEWNEHTLEAVIEAEIEL